MAKSVLGKGLDALIPKRAVVQPEQGLSTVPIDEIVLSRFQPRQEIDESELKELAGSIKQQGVIQPIVVRKVDAGYEIVAGWRRYQAAKSLGLSEIPASIKELSDQEAFVLAIIENLQRKDLNAIEEAEAFRRLMEEFNFQLDDISKYVGKNKATVANTLRLLKLPSQIQEALRKGLITRSQAKTILGLNTPEQQQKMFLTIQSEGLSVRDIEHKVRSLSQKKRNPSDPHIVEVEERLQKILGTKVRVSNQRNNRGKVIVEYYSLDDLDRILSRLQ